MSQHGFLCVHNIQPAVLCPGALLSRLARHSGRQRIAGEPKTELTSTKNTKARLSALGFLLHYVIMESRAAGSFPWEQARNISVFLAAKRRRQGNVRPCRW